MAGLRRLSLAATVGVLALFAPVSSAAADPGNGAVVLREPTCETLEGSGTLCVEYDRVYVSNDTVTPSGNANHQVNGGYTWTFTFDPNLPPSVQ